ncbi:uncharacterized protein LOC110617780 [Manihot esculenta]|uniref:Transmembrane protein n=1 Tax=Manihot esculenta TaxID=3983 RepID=A0A2C9VNI4_MANES|nr:uncharacterized protein LOC110617780 [Manihot esculenta]OAY47302.1 hypothetical protein MANES_06G068200v8 [Manihot esculenta]
MACHIPLILAIMITNVGDATARELRPSYHGLDYQNTPPAGKNLPPSAKEFFGASSSPPPPTSTSSNVALPKAMNSNDTTWWRSVNGGKGGGQGGDRLRHVLLVASLACGVTGVALLVVSGFIYYVKHKKQTTSCLDSGKSITAFTDK